MGMRWQLSISKFAHGVLVWRCGFAGGVRFAEATGRDVRPAAQSLFFASPKRSNPKKGDPAVCVPLRVATGATCGARSGRGLARTRHFVAQTVASPDPPSPALLGADRGEEAGQPTAQAQAQAQSPKPKAQSPKSKVQSPKSKVQSPKSKVTRAITAFRPGCRASCAQVWPSEAKASVDGVDAPPVWLRRGAQGWADQGSRLFERVARVRARPRWP